MTIYDQLDGRVGRRSFMRGEELYPHTRGFGGGSSKDASDEFAFIPGPLERQDFNPDSMHDRLQMAERHPWAAKPCLQIPEYIWQHPLEVTDADGSTVTDDPVSAALDELEAIKYRDALVGATQAEFIHGWSVLVLWQEGEQDWQSLEQAPDWVNPDAPFLQRVPGLDSIGRIDWYSPLSLNKGADLPASLMDREGWPKAYRVYYTPSEYVDIDAKRCILICTRPNGNGYKGLSLIYPVWDTLVWSYAMRDSFGFFLAKYGLSSMAIPTQGTMSSTNQEATEGAMTGWHKRGLLLYNGMTGGKPEFIQPEAFDPNPYTELWLTDMAIGLGFPKLWFMGAAVGAVTGSEIDTRNTVARIKQFESAFESPVWRLACVGEPGVFESLREYRLVFPHEEQMSDVEKGDWYQKILSGAPNALQIMSVNEYRMTVLGLGPIPGGEETPMDREKRQAEAMKSSMSVSFGDKKPGQGKPPQGKTQGEESRLGAQSAPSFDVLAKAAQATGTVRGILRTCHTDYGTLIKQRQRYKEAYGTDAPF